MIRLGVDYLAVSAMLRAGLPVVYTGRSTPTSITGPAG